MNLFNCQFDGKTREYLWYFIQSSFGFLGSEEEPHATDGGDDQEKDDDDAEHDCFETTVAALGLLPLVSEATAEAEATEEGGKGHEGTEDDADEQRDVLYNDLLNVVHKNINATAGNAVKIREIVTQEIVWEHVGLDDSIKEDVGDVINDLHPSLFFIVTDRIVAFQGWTRVFTHGFSFTEAPGHFGQRVSQHRERERQSESGGNCDMGRWPIR